MSAASARWCRACGSSPVNGGPPWIAGVFVYRGRVVPVVDLHRLTGVGECPLHLSSRIILLPYPPDAPESLVGLLATQVADIREIRTELVAAGQRPARPAGLGPGAPDGAGILRILDPDSLLRAGCGRIGRIDRRGGDRMSLPGIEAVVRDTARARSRVAGSGRATPGSREADECERRGDDR